MSHDPKRFVEDNYQIQEEKQSSRIPLSDYAKKLEDHVKCLYLEKISLVGIDPVMLVGVALDPECYHRQSPLICFVIW